MECVPQPLIPTWTNVLEGCRCWGLHFGTPYEKICLIFVDVCWCHKISPKISLCISDPAEANLSYTTRAAFGHMVVREGWQLGTLRVFHQKNQSCGRSWPSCVGMWLFLHAWLCVDVYGAVWLFVAVCGCVGLAHPAHIRGISPSGPQKRIPALCWPPIPLPCAVTAIAVDPCRTLTSAALAPGRGRRAAVA